MKALLLATALLACGVAAEKDYEAMFKAFRTARLRSYADADEEAARFGYFVRNMKRAEALESANPLAEFGPNKFADFSDEEFAMRMGDSATYKQLLERLDESTANNGAGASADKKQPLLKAAPLADRFAAAGQSIDWRTKGAVTPVKDQNGCGGCWAFSTTGNIEGRWFLAGNPLTSLSEQMLLSCDHINAGCGGGLMGNAFKWLLLHRRGEAVTSESFPYSSTKGWSPSCRVPAEMDAMTVGAVITGYEELRKTDEDTMAAYVAQAPLSIAIDSRSFQMYRRGIVTTCNVDYINHAVLIVGYDDTNVPPYWIIKNSWGQDWGEQGYMRLAKGAGLCLITEYAATAFVGSGNATNAAAPRL